IVEQMEYTRVTLKTHLVAVQPQMAAWPFCVVDAEGFNHIPHAQHSVFGSSRWSIVSQSDKDRVVPEELDRLWGRVERFYPLFKRDSLKPTGWAGTTVQAMHIDQVEPGLAPLPTVIDHDQEPPHAQNLLSVFSG